MYGLPLGARLEKWWKDNGQKPRKEEWQNWIKIYSKLLLEKMEEMSKPHDHIDEELGEVLGMSKSIGCTKAEFLKLKKFQAEKEDSGATRWTWFLGHSVEIGVLATLACLGFELETQYEVQSKYKSRKSASDAKTIYLGKPALISVKSTGYKMSGFSRNKGKYTFSKKQRRGFAQLPMEGIKFTEHSWWVQHQQEMEAAGVDQGIIIVASKDLIKAYENDEWLAKRNNSLSFYAEFFKHDMGFSSSLEKDWDYLYNKFKQTGEFPPAQYLNKYLKWVDLVEGEYNPENIWGGENQKRTGTFNPCGGCNFQPQCSSIRSINDLHS